MNKVIDKNKLVTLIILLVVGITLLTLGIIFFDPIIEGIKENFVSNNNFIEVLKGLLNTIIITIVSFIIGIIVGMIICLIQGLEGDHPLILVLKNIAKFYVSIFRGTPLMVQYELEEPVKKVLDLPNISITENSNVTIEIGTSVTPSGIEANYLTEN